MKVIFLELFIESIDGTVNERIEIDINEYNSYTDQYTLNWTYANENNLASRNPDDCHEGAATVAAAGRVIAFGSFFGCAPCAFVGGAITALGSIGYIACTIAY